MKKSVRNLTAALLITAALASTMLCPMDTAFAASKFKDVSPQSSSYTAITEMVDKGIIKGYSDNTFKPNEVITLRQAVIMMDRAGKIGRKKYDVKPLKNLSKSHPNYDLIMEAINSGIITPDHKTNTIDIEKPMTRRDMAQMLSVGFDFTGRKNPFTDVPIDNQIYNYVSGLYEYGVTTGYSDNTFRLDEKVTRSSLAVFMHRALNTPEKEEYKYLEKFILTQYENSRFIPVPKDVTDVEAFGAEVMKEYKKRKNEVGISVQATGVWSAKNKAETHHTITIMSRFTQLSNEEVIELLNDIMTTGKVVWSKPTDQNSWVFAFDHSKGILTYGWSIREDPDSNLPK